MNETILKVRDLQKVFKVPRRDKLFGWTPLYAVNGVSFDLASGEVLGIVGESGCGKSTLGRLVLQLIQPTAGQVVFDDIDMSSLKPAELRRMRARMQMVFQDPNGSLNPSMTVGQSIVETLRFHGIGTADERRDRAREMLETVGLDRKHFDRYPHEMSGGQNQRIGIARALIVNPQLIVMDEAVSALDVSVQAQILKLLEDLRGRYKVGILFVSHDLSVVRRVSDRIIVLYLGRIMEIGSAARIFEKPMHPYTIGLIESHPSAAHAGERLMKPRLKGDIPSPLAVPVGCPFSTRCEQAADICRSSMPQLSVKPDGRAVACHMV